MADEILKRDSNRVTVLGAVTDDASAEIRALRVDPTTGRLIVSGTVTIALNVKDEGVSLTTAPTSIDFVGNGVVATAVGTAVTVTITSSGLTDPMTTRGDIIYRNSSNVTARLAVGAANAVLGTNGTDVAWVAATGTGNAVRATSPTLVTPALGVATATSINKVAITAPATSATLTIADGKTLTANASLILAGVDAKTLTLNKSMTLTSAGDSGVLTLPNATDTIPGVGQINAWTAANDFGGATSLEVPNGAGGTTVDATGEVCIDSTSKTLNFYDGAAEVVLTPIQSKSITIEIPTSAEDISIFYTDEAITITKIVFVITGATSATTTIRHHTDRNNAGNEVVTGGTVANSTTSGNVVTSFNDATVPADSFIWLETTALSGTPTTLNATIFYKQDA